jgi:hypothetical protein
MLASETSSVVDQIHSRLNAISHKLANLPDNLLMQELFQASPILDNISSVVILSPQRAALPFTDCVILPTW